MVLVIAVAWTATPTSPSAALAASRADDMNPDTDGDGLSDFKEIHKYSTDPRKILGAAAHRH
jgi:hypothetical protein